MGLLSRNRRRRSSVSSPPPPPGDWMDALQAAMWVDPAVRPKWDRDFPDRGAIGTATHADAAAAADDAADDVGGRRQGPVDFAPVRLADEGPEPPESPPEARPELAMVVPPRVAVRPPSAERPWLTPVPRPTTAAAALPDAVAAPAAVEVLLQWVCRLSRLRRASGATAASAEAFAAESLRADADRYLSAVAAAGSTGGRLRGPLASAVDLVMTRGGLPVVGPWRPIGPVPPGPAYLSAAAAAAADPTGAHDGTWAVHHAVLSLVADLVPGGTDALAGLDAKLNPEAGGGGEQHICPSAYDGVFDHAIVRPVGRPLRAMAAAAVGLLLLAGAAAVLLNVRYVGQIRTSVDAVDRALVRPPP